MSLAALEELYEKETLPEDSSFTWKEFTTFATKLGWQLEEEEKKKAEAALLLVIDARAKRLEFPLVQPEEMFGSVDLEEAEDIICLGRKVNFSSLQAVVEREWEKYKHGTAEHATFGTWVRQYYYAVCKMFCVEETLRTRTFQHRFDGDRFRPLLSPTGIVAEDKAQEVKGSVTKMTSSCVPTLDMELWRKWEEVEKIVRYSGKRVEEIFRSFLEEEYLSTLVEVVQALGAEPGEASWPRYPVTVGGVNEVVKVQRRKLLLATAAGDRLAVEEAMQKEWKETVASMPSYVAVALPADAEENFYEMRYYGIVEEIVKSRGVEGGGGGSVVVPKVEVEAGVSLEEAEKRRALLKTLGTAEMSMVEEEVLRAWEEEVRQANVSAFTLLPTSPPNEYWIAKYYPIMFRMFARADPDKLLSSMRATQDSQGERTSSFLDAFFATLSAEECGRCPGRSRKCDVSKSAESSRNKCDAPYARRRVDCTRRSWYVRTVEWWRTS